MREFSREFFRLRGAPGAERDLRVVTVDRPLEPDEFVRDAIFINRCAPRDIPGELFQLNSAGELPPLDGISRVVVPRFAVFDHRALLSRAGAAEGSPLLLAAPLDGGAPPVPILVEYPGRRFVFDFSP